MVRDHFVCPALEREKLAGVVVAQTIIVGYVDAPTTGRKDFRNKGFGVQIWRLDEDAGSCVTKRREKCLILWGVDAMVIWCPPGFPTDHGDWEGLMWWDRDQRDHSVIRG